MLWITGVIIALLLSSCVYGGDGRDVDLGNAATTEATPVATTEAPARPEIPNEGEDGYSKRY
jgi:hypothetical protein